MIPTTTLMVLKPAWHIIQNIFGASCAVILLKRAPKRCLLDENGDDVLNTVDAFAEHFCCVYCVKDASSNLPSQPGTVFMLSVNEDLVFKCMKCLKPSLSCGVDGIPPTLLKTYRSVPVVPSIFHSSLKSSIFFSTWKVAWILPVHKSGAASAVTNYQPISICCIESKVFESVLHSLLSVSAKNILIDGQHGFVCRRLKDI